MEKDNRNPNSDRIKIVDKVQVDIDQKDKDDFKVLITNKESLIAKISTWTSGFSLLLSVLTVAFTYWIHKEDLKNWNYINLARISIVQVSFLTFRSVTFKELHDTDWGYIPQSQAEPATDSYNPNEASIKSILVASDTISKTYIPNTSSIKVKELRHELVARGYTDINRFVFEKKFQPTITIQNVGLTSCNIDSIVERNFLIDTLNYKNIGANNTQTLMQKSFTLEAGQKFTSGRKSFYLPLNASIPNIQFDFVVYFENINHEKKTKKFRITGGSDDFVVRNIDDIE